VSAPAPYPGQGITGTWHWTGTGQNDAPQLQALIAQAAAIGARLVLHGTILLGSQINLPNNGNPAIIHLAAGCQVVANHTGIVFNANSIGGAPNPPGGATSLTADAAAGATSLTVNGVHGLVAGNAISIVDAASTYVETHIVRSVSTGVINLVEPVSIKALSGYSVKLLPGLAKFEITGEAGSAITGSCNEGIEVQGGYGCLVEGVTIALACSGANAWGGYFDWACRKCILRRVTLRADATNPGTTGWGLEQTTDCVIEDVVFDQAAGQYGNGGGAALVSTNAKGLRITGGSARGSNIAIILEGTDNGVGGHNTLGHDGTIIEGFDASNSNFGVVIRDGNHKGVQIVDLTAPGCLKAAVQIDAPLTGVFATGVQVIGGDLSGCVGGGGAGAITTFGGTGHKFVDFEASGGASAIVANGGDFTASNFTANNCTATSGAVVIAGTVTGAKLSSWDAKGCTSNAFYVDSAVPVTSDILVAGADWTGSGTTNSSGCGSISGGRVLLQYVETGWRADLAWTNLGIQIAGSADVTLEDHLFLLPGNPAGAPVGVSVNASTVTLRLLRTRVDHGGVTGAGGGQSYGVIANQACTILDYGGTDLSLATNAFSLAAGTLTNWITWTATGSAVTVSNIASPGGKAGWTWTNAAASGTVGAPFQATPISGGSATFGSTNSADRSTYTGLLR